MVKTRNHEKHEAVMSNSFVSVRVCSCLFVTFVDYVLSFDYLRHIS